MFGRTLKASIANDNGRSVEFVKKYSQLNHSKNLFILSQTFCFRRKYTDKRLCFECGSDGHLSYKCPGNVLGNREPPPKKIRKNKNNEEAAFDYWKDDSDSDTVVNKDPTTEGESVIKKPKYKKSSYLSDEEELSE